MKNHGCFSFHRVIEILDSETAKRIDRFFSKEGLYDIADGFDIHNLRSSVLTEFKNSGPGTYCIYLTQAPVMRHSGSDGYFIIQKLNVSISWEDFSSKYKTLKNKRTKLIKPFKYAEIESQGGKLSECEQKIRNKANFLLLEQSEIALENFCNGF